MKAKMIVLYMLSPYDYIKLLIFRGLISYRPTEYMIAHLQIICKHKITGVDAMILQKLLRFYTLKY